MKYRLLFPVLLASLLTACSLLASSGLSSAQARWRNANVHHYRYNLSVGCFCAFSRRMPLTIEVQDGVVRSMAYNDGTPVTKDEQQTFSRYSTLDALFDFTSESARRADEIHITYDPTYSFPDKVQIDFIKNAADDELALSVTKFQALP